MVASIYTCPCEEKTAEESELLYLIYKTAFSTYQPLAKSVESSILVSLGDVEDSNKSIKELLRPRMVESLLQTRRQRKQKSPDGKTKKRIPGSFGQPAKPMNLKMIDLNQESSV